MSHAYVLEIEQYAVGLIIRESGGYRFYATKRSFSSLESDLFDTASEAHCAVLDLHGPMGRTRSSMTPLHKEFEE